MSVPQIPPNVAVVLLAQYPGGHALERVDQLREPRESSGCSGRHGGQGTRPHPHGQVHARRRMVSVHHHAGIQGPPGTAGPFTASDASSPRLRCARSAASRTAPSRCTSESGHAGRAGLLDRDINAAVNVAEAAGLVDTACGARVRPGLVPAPREETGTHPKASPGSGSQAGISILQGGEDVKTLCSATGSSVACALILMAEVDGGSASPDRLLQEELSVTSRAAISLPTRGLERVVAPPLLM